MITVLEGDNVATLRRLEERFALAYLDPPFFSQKRYGTSDGEPAFDDRWPSLEAYIGQLDTQLRAVKPLLIPEGCIVVHVDPTVSHYVKVMGDRVFGFDSFANEIVWRYRRWPSPTRAFQWMHDVLLRWTVSDEPRWNQPYEPLSASTIKTFKGIRQFNEKVNGKRVLHRERGGVTSLDTSPGAPMADVWDIAILAQGSVERTGYPTQKPEALLARLIDACTNPGDWVLDPFCGSGTTLAVCAKRGRNAVGIDASPVAIRYTNERLAPILAQGTLFTQESA